MKFGTLSTGPNTYDFSEADALVEFAEAAGIQVRGHVLVWHLQLPYWLTKGKFSREDLVEILENHIRTVVGRYSGRIAVWDVVNEAIADNGLIRETLWSRTIGLEYLDIAFRAAREADPSALLFYNDYGLEGSPRHSDAVYGLVRNLLEKEVPVDGVGLQMHLSIDDLSLTQNLAQIIQRLGELGLRVHVTEFDVRMKLDYQPTAEQLAAQALVYRNIMRSCLEATNCEALAVWGITDRHSWIPHYYIGHGAALLFDEEYVEKPCYWALASELGQG